MTCPARPPRRRGGAWRAACGLAWLATVVGTSAHAAPGSLPALVPGAAFARLREGLPDRATHVWTPQHCAASETALDRQSYVDLNRLRGSKLLDRADGWSVEARIGGRPFHCFPSIRVGDDFVAPAPSDFDATDTSISMDAVNDHFRLGKSINRLWFLHPATSGEFPVTVVFTADGFMVVGGASAPRLLGTTLRTGIIGEPFGDGDFAQHVEDIVVRELDVDTIELTYLVDSEAAVAAVECTLRWDAAREAPTLTFRVALRARVRARLGFVGGNALRGPTLHGLLDECGDPPPQGGIAAFHDVQTASVVLPDGRVIHDLLVPPLGAHTVERRRLVEDLPPSGRLILDQSQHVRAGAYFSHHPGIPYRDRADLIIKLDRPPRAAVSVERAQVAADLTSINPEANETVNVFLATEAEPGVTMDVGFSVDVAADDLDRDSRQLAAGVVYAESIPGVGRRLTFLPLDESLVAVGEPGPLTGPVLLDPRRPSASSDGRWIAFDATGRAPEARRGIYLLNRLDGSLRRLTVDPGSGASFDRAASLDGSARRFVFVSNRSGSQTQALVAEVSAGQGCGFGEALGPADDVTFDPAGGRIARAHDGAVVVQHLDGSLMTVVSAHLGAREPAFSPDGSMLAFASESGVWVADLWTGSERRVAAAGDSPTWAGTRALIVQRTEAGETDLHAVDLATLETRRITPRDGLDARDPVFVGDLPRAGRALGSPGDVGR